MPTNHQAYKVNPNLYSFVSIAFTVGLCGGVVWGGLAAVAGFLDGDYESPGLWSLVALIATPVIQAFSFAITAAVGYPIFKWWCSKSNGIYIEGTFSETNQKHL